MRLSLTLTIAVLLTLGGATLAAQTDVHALADKVDQRYDHLHTLQADFTETYTGARVQRFLFKGVGPVEKDQGVPWPKAR